MSPRHAPYLTRPQPGTRHRRGERSKPYPIGWGALTSTRSAFLLLLAGSDLYVDGAADEAEVFAEAAFDEALVRRFDLAGGEDGECRRHGRGLGAEEDLGLFAGADRVRVRRHQPAEEGVQLAGRDAGLPALQRCLDGRHELLHVPP